MSSDHSLQGLLIEAARLHSNRIAVEDLDEGKATYKELDRVSSHIRDVLARNGVVEGSRVGLYAPKSNSCVASVFAILKAGAAYVPADPAAPPRRSALIFNDCSVASAIMDARLVKRFLSQLDGTDLQVQGEPERLEAFGTELLLVKFRQNPSFAPASYSEEKLAYILYTSGSTGTPKGVMHSHASALSFVDWCSQAFEPTFEDRFSSHAPFHFDLSILDIYVPIKHGGAVVLIGEELGRQPPHLARTISERRLSVWYSTPSILRLLVEYGKLSQYDCPSLRTVLFAGEVFPIKNLCALRDIWPKPRYFNLYGPTETNVCTYYEVPAEIPPGRTEPLPIGRACSGDETKVVDELGREANRGDEGELYVSGGSVMLGYWNRPELNLKVFSVDDSGKRWYRTGDVVREGVDGNYIFLGRRDRMVKRRGYRVELGEIESALYRHPSIREAAVIATADEESGTRVKAFLDWSGERRPSVVELKQFCAENLPAYMIPDRFSVLPALPKTSTDKIDYQRLKELD